MSGVRHQYIFSHDFLPTLALAILRVPPHCIYNERLLQTETLLSSAETVRNFRTADSFTYQQQSVNVYRRKHERK